MKLLKNILIFILCTTVFLANNGFVLEKYLCFLCDSQHKELAFFEFGEINHNHNCCCNQEENHEKSCSCPTSPEDHLRNSEISFYSLKLLFLKKSNNEIFQNVIKIINSFNYFNAICNTYNIQTKGFYSLIKIPPLINIQFLNSLDFYSLFSIFRL